MPVVFSVHKLKIPIIKSNTKVSNLVKTKIFNNFMNFNLKNRIDEDLYCVMGHSRMVTSGSSYDSNNNQPIIKKDLLILHNGIITNEDILTNTLQRKNCERKFKVDTEVYSILVDDYMRQGFSFLNACIKSFNLIEGANTIVAFNKKYNQIFLSTSNGSMYYVYCKKTKIFIFSSESYF